MTTTHEIQLDPGESVSITNADPAARLRIEALSRTEIVVESFLRGEPPPVERKGLW